MQLPDCLASVFRIEQGIAHLLEAHLHFIEVGGRISRLGHHQLDLFHDFVPRKGAKMIEFSREAVDTAVAAPSTHRNADLPDQLAAIFISQLFVSGEYQIAVSRFQTKPDTVPDILRGGSQSEVFHYHLLTSSPMAASISSASRTVSSSKQMSSPIMNVL